MSDASTAEGTETATQAAHLYARAVVILQESLRVWHDEGLRRWLWLRARRVVQEVIDLGADHPDPFLWLIHRKDRTEYLPWHGTNVALLALLTGLRAGLSRRSLRDLGTAALFHDLGRIGVPAHVRIKGGEFGSDEVREMGRHPIHGANLLLGLDSTSESLMTLLIVVFEHNIDSNGYPRPSWPQGLHLFSRIVAMVDAYDAMTTPRSFRPGKTPDEAMREIVRSAGTRYDVGLVEVFRSFMGIYPPGTLVRLDTTELGLVAGVSTEHPVRPRVLIVLDGDGRRLDAGPLLDLRERDSSGRFLRSIVSAEDPARHGIHVPGFANITR